MFFFYFVRYFNITYLLFWCILLFYLYKICCFTPNNFSNLSIYILDKTFTVNYNIISSYKKKKYKVCDFICFYITLFFVKMFNYKYDILKRKSIIIYTLRVNVKHFINLVESSIIQYEKL